MTAITNFSSPEQANGAGDVYANNLTIFGQEVLADYMDRNLTSALIRQSTIVDSKTKQFDRIGKTTAGYHAVGSELLGSSILANKIDIFVDDRPIVSDVFLDNAEHILNHFEERAEFVAELGLSISDLVDERNIQVLANASVLAAPVTSGPTGGTAVVANSDTDMAVLVAELFTARAAFAANNVSLKGLNCVVNPTVFHLLAQENDVINQDLNEGLNGGFNKVREVIMVAGIRVLMTNHMPDGVVGADALDGNDYAGTFTNLTAVIWEKNAAMQVVAKPLTTETNGYDVRTQGTTIVGKTFQGTGILRNEAAYTIYHT